MAHEQAWQWPDEFDALNAAPQHHALLFENEFLRMLDTRIPAGQTVPLDIAQRWRPQRSTSRERNDVLWDERLLPLMS